MFSGDVVVVVVCAGRVRAAHMTRSAAGWSQRGSAVLRPLSVVTDGLGDPVSTGTAATIGLPVDGLLSRVGDPVPVRVGTRSWPAEQLVAHVIADAVATLAAPPPEHLVLVVPDEWRTHRTDVLRRAVTEATGRSVTTVATALGLVGPGTQDERVDSAMVLETEDECFRAAVLDREDGGWQVRRTSRSDWGGTDIDDALLDFVGDRTPSGLTGLTGLTGGVHDATSVRAVCAQARQDLTRLTATEVDVPGTGPVRVVRADLELLAGRTVADVVNRLVTDVVEADRDVPARVLVTGSLGSLPMVVEALSAAVGAAVEHVTEEHALERYAAAGAADIASTSTGDAPSPSAPDEDTDVLGEPAYQPTRHQRIRGHRRRAAVLVAASLTVTAPVAAMTLTETGESTLLSIVDGIVPQASSAGDPGSGDVLGSLTDAVTLPPTPWSTADDSGDATAETDGSGDDATSGGAADADTPDPTPTSTRGGREGTGEEADRANGRGGEHGKGRSAAATDRASHTGKGAEHKAAEGRAKGRPSDTGRPSDRGGSSAHTSTPDHIPSTPAPPTTDPVDETTAPATSDPDPTSTTSEPDPTVPAPSTTTPPPSTTTPPPSTTTPPPSTTSTEPPVDPSAAGARTSSARTIPPEPGTP